ncbi:sugar ABC transporter ATP-binding protein [Yersinia massiliensis]|jgi:erythritol transport system ATP-binding protein|uniref:Sugar ABC transporter ATP-binding protein n=2 Tax=Yersinia TaxID=629 RepID=A0A0T9NM29_9GAMM|nr:MULTISPECIES: sugar ABC transporter ATP-binding protein [Yersinia]HEI6965263.1 sugar ABC transporter ATP-binding protein [Yersinia enterocolitica]ATM84788.1 sugar ABC transporter ATP-binding protein [Yersinia frederiksenii]AVX39330.1 sugar ABC transporter ATP-binding protein [Yersinia massiliensis]MCB5317492.1 sugar ABC transporter ATP-binding protein [Yersinia massiliensis]MDA5547029.1 sugar ABC transporter ATP-binding protein [Yersinia massiliensis]
MDHRPDIVMRAEDISMRFPGTLALDSVSYNVYRGKVNVIIGENGAGKSTLMKILAGVQQQTSGQIYLNGQLVTIANTREAAALGIGMVHQELNLSENLNVAENIFLGREIQQGLKPINQAAQELIAEQLMVRLDQAISPKEMVSNLKVGQQQLIEIAKALAEQADILILDEPTSALSKTEVDILFRVIRELTRQGVSIVYISHRLEELMAIGDYITILRDGRFQAEAAVKDIDVPWIVREMLGSDPVSSFLHPDRTFGAPMMEVDNVTLINESGNTVVNQVSLQVRAGEIVGIYGLMGAGRTELFECLLGTQQNYLGTIRLNGTAINGKTSTAERIRLGMSLVPEDRKKTGIFPVSSVANNLTISSLWRRLKNRFAIWQESESQVVATVIGDLSIKVSSPEVEIQALSGGNQQKVVIGRSLLTSPNILLLDEPTRGIDVGAKADVFEMMVKLSEQGIGILFSTSDLKEIMAVSDRILVMSNGKLTANVSRQLANESALVTASAQGFE